MSEAFRGSFGTQHVTKEPRKGKGTERKGKAAGRGTELRWRRLEVLPDAAELFAALYGDSETAFWLDSSRPGERGRFSFMGDASGPLGRVVSYDVDSGEEPLLDRLDRELAALRPANPPDLPFEFSCGFAGYLGYELKADCGAASPHSSPHPDAQLVFAARMLALDHHQNHTYLLSLCSQGAEPEADEWLAQTSSRVVELAERAPLPPPGGASAEPPRCCSDEATPGGGHLALARPRERYLADVAHCLDRLHEGESYEVCLTNSIAARLDGSGVEPSHEAPLELYRRLRRVNPAPFAAYLRFGELAVLSSSPERFLAVDDAGGVEARPIKGTSRRDPDPVVDARLAAELAADEKNRAENLMIADLLRNDLGSVCERGSVAVPSLMAVESYETVHQLVSTVRGSLRPGVGAAAAVRACFPPGSMTGAPKLRTTEILDELEGAPRGVYSGAIGWFGLGGGCDLSVAIRTIVLAEGVATVGAGGAIVVDSDPEREWEEMLLKAAAALRAIDPGLDPAPISLGEKRRGAAAATPPASVPDLTS